MNYVILAGGSGTRLWPMSRSASPKQLAKLVTNVTMIEDTINRLEGVATPEQLYISTNERFAPVIREILPQIPKDHYIVEPEKRDTGPAMAFSAAWLSIHAPDEPMILMPSDHHVKDTVMWGKILQVTDQVIRETGKMVNFGITPTFPNVNLGYLKIGKELENRDGVKLYEFGGQKEKPDVERARQFLEEGTYLWNGGYFAWTPTKFLEAYQRFAPSIGQHLEPIVTAIKDNDREGIARLYHAMEARSIDYAVIEKMDPVDVITIRTDVGWADLGSWDMLYDQLSDQADAQGNLIKAHWHGLETTGSLVYAPEGKVVTTIGLENMVVVDTPDALFISPKDRAPEIKKIVDLLKEHGAEHVL